MKKDNLNTIWSRSEFVLLMAVAISTTLAYGTVHQPIIALFYIAVALGVIFWAADGLGSGTLRFSRVGIQLPLWVLAAYGVVQFIPLRGRTISIEPFSTQVTVLHMVFLALFFGIALVYLDSAARIRKAATILAVFGFVYAFYSILQHLLSPEKIYGIYHPQSARPFGSFVNRDDFAAMLELLIALPLGALFTGAVAREKRLLYWVAVAIMGSAILLSGSRGGLVCLIVEIGAVILLATRTGEKKQLMVRFVLSVVLLAAAVAGAVFVGGDTSMTRLAEGTSSPDASSSRLAVWRATVHMIGAYMPFGTGLGAFGRGFPQFDTQSGLQTFEQAHNDYLQVASDAGIAGVVIGLTFLFFFFRTARSNVRVANRFRRAVAVGAAAGCIAILTHSLFDFVLHITAISVMFLMLLALLVASGREYPDDSEERVPAKERGSASVTTFRAIKGS